MRFFLSPDTFLALGMKIAFPVEYGVVITWWRRASVKWIDWKMSGALCCEIRCRQHSFEVMWSLRGNTLAAFYPNQRSVWKQSKSWENLRSAMLRVDVSLQGTVLGLPLPWFISGYLFGPWTSTARLPIVHWYIGSTKQLNCGKLWWWWREEEKMF